MFSVIYLMYFSLNNPLFLFPSHDPGGRVFIAKNRNGPDGIVFPIFMDTSNVKIDVLPKSKLEDNAAPVNKNKGL